MYNNKRSHVTIYYVESTEIIIMKEKIKRQNKSASSVLNEAGRLYFIFRLFRIFHDITWL